MPICACETTVPTASVRGRRNYARAAGTDAAAQPRHRTGPLVAGRRLFARPDRCRRRSLKRTRPEGALRGTGPALARQTGHVAGCMAPAHMTGNARVLGHSLEGQWLPFAQRPANVKCQSRAVRRAGKSHRPLWLRAVIRHRALTDSSQSAGANHLRRLLPFKFRVGFGSGGAPALQRYRLVATVKAFSVAGPSPLLANSSQTPRNL